MIRYYGYRNGKFAETGAEAGSLLVELTGPSPEEIAALSARYDISRKLLEDVLDEDEVSRLSVRKEQITVYVDVPFTSRRAGRQRYRTLPAGFITGVTGNRLLTVTGRKLLPLDRTQAFLEENGIDRELGPQELMLILLMQVAGEYTGKLKKIVQDTAAIEEHMPNTMQNREVMQLMEYKRGITGMEISLDAMRRVLDRMVLVNGMAAEPGRKSLLDELIIETEQAMEMAAIYSSDIRDLLEACHSVISNNLNVVMKILTAMTVILAIPTMIAGFFGMNVRLPMAGLPAAFWIIAGLSLVISATAAVILIVRKLM